MKEQSLRGCSFLLRMPCDVSLRNGNNNKQNYRELFSCLLFLTNKFCYTLVYIIKRTYICHTERDEKRAALVGLGNSSNYSENRDIASSSNGGPRLRVAFMPVDYKGGEHSKPVIRSFIASLVRLHYKAMLIQKISIASFYKNSTDMIFYFSGTGNSAWVARQLAEGQNEELLSIAMEIDRNKAYKLKEGEKVGFVFPVYAWGPPKIVLRFIHQLKLDKPGYLFFVCTCGDDTGRTAQIFSSAVTRKGWQCVAGYSVTMPNTYVSLPGFDVDDKDIETQKVQNAVARVRFINEEITSRAQMKQYNCHEGALPFTKSYLLRPLFNAFLMSPKPFHATEACIGCKKCEKVCPVGNITVTDRPVWGGNCTQCLACYHVCPVHAVEYGKMTGKKGQYKGRLLKDL